MNFLGAIIKRQAIAHFQWNRLARADCAGSLLEVWVMTVVTTPAYSLVLEQPKLMCLTSFASASRLDMICVGRSVSPLIKSKPSRQSPCFRFPKISASRSGLMPLPFVKPSSNNTSKLLFHFPDFLLGQRVHFAEIDVKNVHFGVRAPSSYFLFDLLFPLLFPKIVVPFNTDSGRSWISCAFLPSGCSCRDL